MEVKIAVVWIDKQRIGVDVSLTGPAAGYIGIGYRRRRTFVSFYDRLCSTPDDAV